MNKWHVSEKSIYDENGQQIIETSEWYMVKELEMICEEHNKINSDEYVLIKLSKRQMKDAEECEKMAENNEEKDCSECSCGTCILQG